MMMMMMKFCENYVPGFKQYFYTIVNISHLNAKSHASLRFWKVYSANMFKHIICKFNAWYF